MRRLHRAIWQAVLCAALAIGSAVAAGPAEISYTYVYEPDSINPGEPEWSTPSRLNDGLIGVGWDAATMLYGNATPVAKMPYVTLTLAQHDALGKLTVWYVRSIEAGIAQPASVTVSDDFGHSATTVFDTPPANGTFSQDVALTAMQGTVLHLNFTGVREWVGLDEIRVFGPDPVPPSAPTGPRPSDGNVNVPVTNRLGWNVSVGADGYDVYLWIPPASQPLTPTASGAANEWAPAGIRASEATYAWQVVATNAYGAATGAVWTFTTSISPYTYAYDDVSAKPENYLYYVEGTVAPHFLNDGLTGSVYALYSGPDYLGLNPAQFWPAITLTLTEERTYEYLRIWHYGGGGAGIHAPSSLTVTDGFQHTATFASFPDVEPTFTDVPITEMQGARLHLKFGPNSEFVGLSEIKVVGRPLDRHGALLMVQ